MMLCIFSARVSAQGSVGINQTSSAPDASAMLDVSATNKGLLVPRVNLLSVNDAATISSPANSLLIYNTNPSVSGGTGYFFNAGSGGAPIWTKLQTAGQPLGQTATSYYSTASITVPAAGSFTALSGFPVTVNVPANCNVIIHVDGGAQTTSTSATGFSVVDIVALVDGTFLPGGAYQRVQIANVTGLTNQIRYVSFSAALSLSAGNHSFSIAAAGTGSGSATTVGGDGNSVLQAALTITILKN